MFRNYFKTAWRNIRKNKLFSFITSNGFVSGDGWTFTAAAGWVVRAGTRKDDLEVVKEQ